jgi:hypothetical protein
MGTSRRNFLKNGSLVALVMGLPVSLAHGAAGRENIAGFEDFDLNKAAFLSQLKTDFLITQGGSTVTVKLVDVSDLPRRGASGVGEGFSLVFQGNRSKALKQNTYEIEHDSLGNFSFLLVPIMSKDKSALYYEAVINRLYP